MINPYCESLKGFFSEMVYYGILKGEDAQCFKTDVQVKPTFYLLFSGAIVLALINSFVMKAVTHYLRDITSPSLDNLHSVEGGKGANLNEDIEDSNQNETFEKSKIHPVPVLFTDQYRWFLQREDKPLSHQYSESFENSDDMQEPSFADSSEFTEDIGLNKDNSIFSVENHNNFARTDEKSFDDGSIYTCTNDPDPMHDKI